MRVEQSVALDEALSIGIVNFSYSSGFDRVQRISNKSTPAIASASGSGCSGGFWLVSQVSQIRLDVGCRHLQVEQLLRYGVLELGRLLPIRLHDLLEAREHPE